jgi:hypothetical protein
MRCIPGSGLICDRKDLSGRSTPRLCLPEERRISCKQARQNHLGGRVALTERFTVTGAPVGYRGIHAAARLGQGKTHG